MKRIISLFSMLVLYNIANATNYYFAVSGNDSNAVNDINHPYKTLTKLNKILLAAGDTVFFKCNDVFRGQITVTAKGTSNNPIVFTCYGTGNKPVISGAEIVSGWTKVDSIYERILTQKMNNFFINEKEQIPARYPNIGRYLTYDSSSKNYLKDASLTSIPVGYINGSQVCLHSAQWCWEKSSIASYNNNEKITFRTPVHVLGLTNYGYFLYDNIALLDTANEFNFDSVSMKLTYQPPVGVVPDSVIAEAAVYNTGFAIQGTASYIVIKNIQIEKQTNIGIYLAGAGNQHIRVEQCVVGHQYNYGIQDKGKYNEISNCLFKEVDGIALMVSGGGSSCTIHHNSFHNIGTFRNSGVGTEINGSAILLGFSDSNYIHHNDIDSTGYCGISADGTNNLVEKNTIKNVMLLNNDGAAIKSFGAGSYNNIFQNNFVTTSDGNTEGCYKPDFSTPAIYFDFNVNNTIIRNNTVYGRTQKGIFQNAGDSNNTIEGNVIYGANCGIDLNGSQLQTTVINGMKIKHNAFWLKNSKDYIFRQVDYSNKYTFGTIDSNYYYQPYNVKDSLIYRLKNLVAQSYSYNSWLSAGNDQHTIVNSFHWNKGVDSSVLFINPTDSNAVQQMNGWTYKDLDGNIVTSLTLAPWTSKILIKTTTSLPVTFSRFTAEYNRSFTNCKWSVENETAIDNYEIYISTTGSDFQLIGTTEALQISNYTYIDETVASVNADRVYYRIAAVNKDGARLYSNISMIEKENRNFNVAIYPNPAFNNITIKGTENIKQIDIVELGTGRVVKSITLNDSSQMEQLSVNSLSKGTYILKVTSSTGSTICSKLLKE